MIARKPDAVDVEVGQRIKIRRLAAGLSQTDLADGLGITFQQVQKYEKGVNRVGAGRLTRIAQVLKVPVITFFDGHGNTAGAAAQGKRSPLSFLADADGFRLLQAYSMLSDVALRRSILEMVEKLALKRSGQRSRRSRRYTRRE
jgi:transcriptional regulator with XRE-family HTH domain